MKRKGTENKTVVFKWHFLLIYLLVAAVISYFLVDYKIQKELPTGAESTNSAGEVIAVTEENNAFGGGDSLRGDAVPGTIGEVAVSDEESTDVSGTSLAVTTAKKPSTDKTTHSSTTETTDENSSDSTEPTVTTPSTNPDPETPSHTTPTSPTVPTTASSTDPTNSAG